MKVIRYKGGLGNQMFQYAFGCMLKAQYKQENILADFSNYKTYDESGIRKPRILKLNTNIEIATKDQLDKILLFSHNQDTFSTFYKVMMASEALLNNKYYFEKNREWVDPKKLLSYEYLDGYWQSWRYLEGIENQLKTDFKLRCSPGPKTQKAMDAFQNTNSVMVGIRRGDYTNEEKHYGYFGQEFYYHCMDYISSIIENPVFVVFSNDIKAVKESMDFSRYRIIYRMPEDQENDLEELFVMGACKHNIIINSTYQWWGAWLNSNSNKIIIAPQKWFADNRKIDIVPSGWLKM